MVLLISGACSWQGVPVNSRSSETPRPRIERGDSIHAKPSSEVMLAAANEGRVGSHSAKDSPELTQRPLSLEHHSSRAIQEIATGSAAADGRQDAGRSNGTMVTGRTFVNSVDDAPIYLDRLATARLKSGPSSADAGREVASLENLDGILPGKLLVPGYLPVGYQQMRISVHLGGRVADLIYSGPGQGRLAITIGGSLQPQGLNVKRGYSAPVGIGAADGVLIRGGWVMYVHSSGERSDMSWDPNVALTLIYETDGQLIELSAEPVGKLTEDELIKIAESLQPYE